ncbi:MAG: hypothetical protein JEY96_00015 [Bacteroidales bacterium]|nr:hypothetical protein [Bacteroidales bacterium]
MKKNRLIIRILIFISIIGNANISLLNAQTGPGGVGNSDGSNGQPLNILWFDANSLLLNNNDPVSEWTDRSGNNNHGTQVDALRQPSFLTNTLNGYPVISFEDNAGGGGEEDFMNFDGTTLLNTDLTVIYVAARRDNGENFVLGGTTESSNQNLHFGWRNGTQNTCNHWGNDIYSNLIGDGSTYVGDGDPSDDYGIFINRLASGETAPQRRAFQNGTQIGIVNNPNQLSAYGGSAIARWRATPRYYDVNVAEVIFFTKALNAAQMQIINQYLNVKYDISITNDLFDPVSTYITDATGIGETNSEEHSSASSGGLYLTALGGLNNDDYIFVSHNDSSNNSTNFRIDSEVIAAGSIEAYNRIWFIDTVGTPAAEIAFDFSESLSDGLNPTNISNYTLLYRSNTTGNFTKVKNADGLKNGDQVYFNLTDLDLNTGYYTLGTEDNVNSPLEGVAGRTWYTLISGDWDDWEVWTLDPSGALPNNPDQLTPSTSSTNTADNVVIKTGRTVTVASDSLNHTSITIEGRLDLTTTTGHSFGEILGNGRILLATDNFPLGDASHFYTKGQGEGTVEYYGGSYKLNTAREYFDVEIILDNATDTITLLNDYDINGNLTISTGILKINDATDNQIINITVDGDVLVEANAKIFVGTGNSFATGNYQIGTAVMPEDDGLSYHDVFHQFTINGNFTNRGVVRFTNLNAPDYNTMATNGAVTVRLTGASNSEINLYNTTDFYNLIIDKGTDKTYKANLYSDNVNYFRIFGANSVGRRTAAPYSAEDPQIRKALFIYHGTLQLRGNVYIPSLSEGSQEGGNGDYAIGKNARFWMDGSNVTVYSTASDVSQITGFTAADTYTADGVQINSSNQAMSIYGEYRITNGTFGTRNSAGFIFWAAANAQIKIDGGTCNVAQMRSAGGTGGIASYSQTSGRVVVRGNRTEDGEVTSTYPLFGLESTDAVFAMSGGEIVVRDISGAAIGDFYIPSSDGNYNVTGGTVTIEVNETDEFDFYSTANIWNLTVKRYNDLITNTATFHLLNDVVVSNDLIIETPNTVTNTSLDVLVFMHDSSDVTIGRNFTIERGARYEWPERANNTWGAGWSINTTTFNGSENGTLYFTWHDDPTAGEEQNFWNFVVNKTNGASLTIASDEVNKTMTGISNRLIKPHGELRVESGTLNQGNFSVRAYGDIINKDVMFVYDHGVTPDNANLRIRPGNYTIESTIDAEFGLVKFNPGDGSVISLSNDTYIKRLNYHNGRLYLGAYNLKLDHLYNGRTDATYRANNGSVSRMFITDGNASDGGLSLLIHSNRRFTFPLGVGTDGVDVTVGGGSKFTPAELNITNFSDTGYIQVSVADKILATTDPTGGNILSYYWRVRHNGFNTSAEPTVVLDFYYNESDDDASDENSYRPGFVTDESPYTRNVDGNASGVDDANNIINFDNGGSGFTLQRANYTAGRQGRFNGPLRVYYSVTASGQYDWNDASRWFRDTPDTGPNFVPTDGSIVVIRGGARMNISSGTIADLAVVEFDHDYVTNPTPTPENVPRMQFHANGTYDVGNVKGTGMVSFNATRTINLTGDFGDFGSNLESYYLYFGGNATLNSIPFPIPNLMLEGATYAIDQNITINADFIIQGNSNTTPIQDIYVKRDLVLGYWRGGRLHFPPTGSSLTMTIDRNIDFTQYSPQGQQRDIIIDNPGVVSTLEHNLIVKGDIIHGPEDYYDFDLFNASDRPAVVLEFQGETAQRYYRTSNSIPDLYRVIVNKGTSQLNTFTFEDDFNLYGPTNGTTKALELQNGILKLDDIDIDIDLSSGGVDFEIPSTARLQVTQGTVNVYGDNTGIWLDGKLLIDGVNGIVDMINGAGNGNNYIEYSSSGNANIEITDGQLLIGSQIRRGLITEEGVLSFVQSGGEVQLGVRHGGDNDRAIFEILNAGSSFVHSNGDFILVNDYRAGSSIATTYFNPETAIILSGAEMQFGNASTLAGSEDFTLFAGKELMNVTVNTNASSTLTLDIVPLILSENLTINTNSEFDANGLDLTIKGDMLVDGIFTSNQNSTYFTGSVAQQITGSPVFWNLYKTNSNLLTLNNDVDVDNELHLDDGTFNDGDNTLSVQGNTWMDITHTWGGTSDGILLNGSSEQVLLGNGIFGKLSVNNSAGISIPQNNIFTIDGALQLENGVLDVGKNLLIIDEDAIVIEKNIFSENNMIQTNISFTDAGIKKYFTAIIPADNYNFIYPLGSEGKYSPIELSIDNVDAGGSIRVKAANEMHPTIVNDAEPCNEIVDTLNVLKYHWLMEADNINGFTANASMKYYIEDYQENSALYDVTDYIAARLLWGSTLWNKYDQASFDEGNTLLRFSFAGDDDDGISGDYTAGVEDQGGTCEGAIPDEVPAYISISDGDWTDGSIWETYPIPGGFVPLNGPRGAVAIVEHEVTIPSNYILNYKTTINSTGIVKVGSTFGHRLGIIEGTGTLQLERGNLPAGIYDDFFSRSGGTIEFTGNTDYDVLSEVVTVRNLKFTGTGERRLPNLDFEVFGLLTIAGDDANLHVINEHDRNMTLDSNVVFTQGSFDAGIGTSKVTMNGTYNQTITGNFTDPNEFLNLEIDNSAGVTLAGSVEVDGVLEFVDGIITTSVANILIVDNAAETTAVVGYNSSNYVDGPMRKLINSGDDFIFPVGDNTRYGQLVVTNATASSAGYWESEYYNANPHPTYDTSSYAAPLNMVSGNEYWRLSGPELTSSADVTVRWDSQSGLSAMTSDRVNNLHMAQWITGTPDEWQSVGTDVTDGGVNSGTIKSNAVITLEKHYFTIGSNELAPLPTATFISSDISICAGQSTNLQIGLTGAPNWTVTIEEGGDSYIFPPQATSPLTFSVDSAGTYTITAISDMNGAGVVFGNDVIVTVAPVPALQAINGGGTYCQGASGLAIGLDGSELGVNYHLVDPLSATVSVVAGSGGAISFGTYTDAGTYTIEAYSAIYSACSTPLGTVDIIMNNAPIVNMSILNDTICDGDDPQIQFDFIAGAANFSVTITDGTNSETINGIATNPYQYYLPTVKPLWNVADGISSTYTYTITNITDSNGCSNVGSNTVDVDVFKVPSTGPNYHIPNDWGN